MTDNETIRLIHELRAAVLTYTAMALSNSAGWDGTNTDDLDPGDVDLTIAALIHIAHKGHQLVNAAQGNLDRIRLN